MIEDAVTQFEKTMAPHLRRPVCAEPFRGCVFRRGFYTLQLRRAQYNSPGFKLPVGALMPDYTAQIAALP
jgi:hypothetical protein